MQMLAERLAALSRSKPTSHLNLTVVPLVSSDILEPDYLLLDEALTQGFVRITEVSESGSVPELRLENNSPHTVLLLDGEELVGAKQNRVLNLTILSSAGKTIAIPVSCVEAGRWSHRSREFSSEHRAYYSSGRASKSEHVTSSLRSHGGHESKQHEVWNDIAAKSRSLGSHSPTGAMSDIYDDHKSSIEDYVNALQPVDGQVGAVFILNGRARGLEMFDCATTLHKLYPKLIRSWAFDAINERNTPTHTGDSGIDSLLAATANAETSTHPGIGEGEDIRLSGANLNGGALFARERLIHLCAFSSDQLDGSESAISGHMQRASMRGRGPRSS